MLATSLALLPAGSASLVPGMAQLRHAPARPVLAAMPTKAARTSKVSMVDLTKCARNVPLTGKTLDASLKIRCDSTKAAYAIYWTRVNDELQVAGSYVAAPQAAGFVAASTKVKLDANGDGPIAQVKRSGENFFVADVALSNLKRKELALQYGISQVAMIPFEDGVVEFGTTCTSVWQGVPPAPSMPKRVLRKAFEELGALYAIYWAREGDDFNVQASYENPTDVIRRKSLRGDGESFVSISKDLTLSANGDGPVATALKTNEEVVIVFTEGNDYSEVGCASMKRSAKAREHGICTIHFQPVIDEATGTQGVLEYGISTTGQLSRVTLDATLKMQAESAGAAYAVYWKKHYSSGIVEGTPYVAQWHRDELDAAGKKLSYAEVSQAVTYDMLGDSPVAEVMRTRKAKYVQDVKAVLNSERAKIAEEYMIESSAFVPVLGGVIEYGTSASRPWKGGEECAFKQIMPNEEIDEALKEGATYIMYWDRDDEARTYKQTATFELAKNKLTLNDKVDKSFLTECKDFVLDADGLGPIGACGRSASKIVVANTATYPTFKRRELAQEWGVGKITCVPLENGVLEYGTVTKDKRETTFGSEYQEASRVARRTVYMHDDWVKSRSTDTFFRSMQTILESGIVRARNRELSITIATASLLCLWNGLAGGFTDLDNVKHGAILEHLPVFSVPLSVFSLTAPSLGLLLVFKTNSAYGRWDNARKVWGDIINKCRSLVRQANTFFIEDRYPGYGNFRDYRRRVAAETSAFTRCLRCFLRGKEDEENLRVELKMLGFEPEEIRGYMNAANKQVYALQKIGETMKNYGMTPMDRANMDATLTGLCDDVGACERIFKTPIPLVYTRHTTRFSGTWLALLPLAIWGADPSWNHLATIPSCAIIVFFLLGIEELGSQLEEPFGILPIEAFCDGSIGAALNEMVVAEDKAREKVRQIEAANAATVAKAEAAAEAAQVAEAAPSLYTSTVTSTVAAVAEKPAAADNGVITPTAPIKKESGLRAKLFGAK